MSRIASLVRPNIAALAPYSTARDEYDGPIGIFLDANESPYQNGYNRYPDPHQAALKAMIAPLKGIRPENLFLGNGSDEAIDLVFRIFCVPGKDNAVIMAPSYGMYGVAAAINDIEVRSVQLDSEFRLESSSIEPSASVVISCTSGVSKLPVSYALCVHSRSSSSVKSVRYSLNSRAARSA